MLEEDNITEDKEYYYLTELAAKCTAKRMVPDYISEKVMKKLKGDVYTCMGCRSFLTPDRFTENGVGNIANAKNYDPTKHKYYGRFNQGVVTINLVDVACSSGGDMTKFWKILMKGLTFATVLLCAATTGLKVRPVTPLLFFGNTALLQGFKRARRLMSFFMTAIQQFLSATQVFMNVQSI